MLAVIFLTLADTDTRSVLIGGIAASGGPAVAFYFSSVLGQGREDILAAAFGRETVPDLVDQTLQDATKTIPTTALILTGRTPDRPTDEMFVDKQDRQAGVQVPTGSPVMIDFRTPERRRL